MSGLRWIGWNLCWIHLSLICSRAFAAPPQVLEAGYRLELLAEAPEIVTPVAITFDSHGHLYVIESHTHHRPDTYEGPAHDRIVRMKYGQGAKPLDNWTTFYDQTDQTMSVLAGTDGWLYVATRREIFRLKDTNDDGRADEVQSLIKLVTDGDYPHNGLAGLAWTPSGRLAFGLGENLGASYRLVASDGSEHSGAGEGGNVFECLVDGSQITRIATGFWNPFGSVFDPMGRWFVVDNDPDASPPCRLLHVVPTADFGYQFRYGRSGRHPLQAWDGELPGTLPMAAGTGEAPCQLVPYRGRLWVTSWGDHRLEAFSLVPHGASVRGQLSIVVQGDADFRPVGLAIAPDGALVFSDWVDRSYPVHRQGRLWRLVPDPKQIAKSHAFPPLSADELRANQLRRQPDVAALEDDDPYLRQAVVAGWVAQAKDGKAFATIAQLPSSAKRLGWMQAASWLNPSQSNEWIPQALSDAEIEPQLYALRIIAGEKRTEFASQVASLLDASGQGEFSRQQASRLRLALATLAWLEQGDASRDTDPFEDRLLTILRNENQSATLRALAIRLLPTSHEALDQTLLTSLLAAEGALPSEVVNVLQERSEPWAAQMLIDMANNERAPVALRADAIAALAAHRESHQEALEHLLNDTNESLRIEAVRSLGRAASGETRPSSPDLDDWLKQIDSQPGDPDAGRRVFFRANGPRCSVCHLHGSRGGRVGPDLSTISRREDRRWLLQAILEPNRDVAPRYASVQWITDRGTAVTGLPLSGPGEEGRESLIGVDGQVISLPSEMIAERHSLSTSIMPSGLDGTLSVAELRDLLAFLRQSQ